MIPRKSPTHKRQNNFLVPRIRRCIGSLATSRGRTDTALVRHVIQIEDTWSHFDCLILEMACAVPRSDISEYSATGWAQSTSLDKPVIMSFQTRFCVAQILPSALNAIRRGFLITKVEHVICAPNTVRPLQRETKSSHDLRRLSAQAPIQ